MSVGGNPLVTSTVAGSTAGWGKVGTIEVNVMTESVRHSLSLLLNAYGYNLYDQKNRARADDLLVREKTAGALAEAANALGALRIAYRRRFIPPPTREQPEPPPEHLARLQEIAELQQRLADLETRIRSASAPTQDAVWERFRREQTLLNQLLLADYNLIEPAGELRDQILALTPTAWNDETATALVNAIGQIEVTFRQRAALLQLPGR